jgi:hypothetical protein
MAKLITDVTLNVSMEELKALHDLLKLHSENSEIIYLQDSTKDVLNGIYFSINDTLGFKQN